jgi:hypothetical protein
MRFGTKYTGTKIGNTSCRISNPILYDPTCWISSRERADRSSWRIRTMQQSDGESHVGSWSNQVQVFNVIPRQTYELKTWHINAGVVVAFKGDQLNTFVHRYRRETDKRMFVTRNTGGFPATQMGMKLTEYIGTQTSLSQVALHSLISNQSSQSFKTATCVQMSVCKIVRHGTLERLGRSH